MCLNVVEHIEQDRTALTNMYATLAPGGKAIILVPAFQQLYCKIDENLEHFRRYTDKELAERMREAGFVIRKTFYFNPVGGVGWFVVGKVFRATEIGSSHIFLQKLLMPVSYLLDALGIPFGLSVVCVGEKAAAVQVNETPATAKAQVTPRLQPAT